MKRVILSLALLFTIPARPAVAADETPLSVAVFDFESKEEAIRDVGAKLANLVNAHLSATTNLLVVERAEIEKALGEQELGLSGTVSSESAAKVGHLVGAKVLVTGKVFKSDLELMVVTKVIGTETSRVYGELAKGPASGPLDDLASKVAEKIAAVIASKRETFVVSVPTHEDRVAAIKKVLGQAKLPSVAIRLPERHFGAPVADPAAETELGLILQQCGFTILDEKATAKPDVEITGEAFSAFGVRRGNLISCKARIEVKAHARKDGKLLAIDRETTVSVDVAEQTAAKTALQKAAAELAARLAPKLILDAKVAAQ